MRVHPMRVERVAFGGAIPTAAATRAVILYYARSRAPPRRHGVGGVALDLSERVPISKKYFALVLSRSLRCEICARRGEGLPCFMISASVPSLASPRCVQATRAAVSRSVVVIQLWLAFVFLGGRFFPNQVEHFENNFPLPNWTNDFGFVWEPTSTGAGATV
jgi:hypothetical protein